MNSLSIQTNKNQLLPTGQARALVELGIKNGWKFAVLGIAPMPQEIITLSEWEIVPAHLDTSHIPARALERIQAIYAAGIRPQGFVIAHELPMESGSRPLFAKVAINNGLAVDLSAMLEVGGKLLGSVALGVITAIGIAVPTILSVGSALLLDPILVAVTEDNEWVEIDRWVN